MKNTERVSIEHAGFVGLWALLLSPIIAHAVWRPLMHIFGQAGNAVMVTTSVLVIALTIAFSWWFVGKRWAWFPLISGGLLAYVATNVLSLGTAGLLTLLITTLAISSIIRWFSLGIPSALDGLIVRNKFISALYIFVSLLSILSVARLSTYMGDPTRIDLQALPGDSFVGTHSCLTAYVRAFDLVREGVENMYDHSWWHGSLGLPPLPTGVENPYSPFSLDNFLYPPPFLFLMESLAWLKGDFFAKRALWFGLNGLLLAFGIWTVAKWMDGKNTHRVILLSPLLLGSVPFLVILQIGNFHLSSTLLSILAMVAFQSNRGIVGGGLLAFTVLSKLSPGIFGLVLLVQKRYRNIVVTAGFGVLFLALSILYFGLNPLFSFVSYALPKLSSGSIFPFMTTDAGILTNRSLFGFPFKLQYLGLELGDPWRLAQWIGRFYTLGLILLTIVAARKGGDLREQVIRWMALLVLAGFQSPFSPSYAALALIWATTLLSVEVRSPLGAIGLFLLWPGALVLPPDLTPITAIVTMSQTILTLGVSVWLILRTPYSLNLEKNRKEKVYDSTSNTYTKRLESFSNE